ncbi:B3 domain-containing protein REM8 [Manihot esculenta]|uniref:Uncharacterized protein n=2 Tax=Manihot esculenta TaxID=3983 RepID=A0ACB7FY46_MANES|nr:B3 domain-containing protein REM8 [Manihot esculenta]KAG8632559.1 hypothetical protein MANES_18G026450v8 [Manihot esculenta]
MARSCKLPVTRHFFKVIVAGFRSKLSLPVAFCRRLKGKRLDKAVVRSSQGSWHIKVGKCRKGLLYFEQGWEDFVTHHDLDLGDFVVFEHKGDMVFDAIVFDSSSCEKEFPVSINFSEKSRKEIDNLSDEFESYSHTTEEGNFKGQSPLKDAQSYSPKGPYFITTITTSSGADDGSYLDIPAEFASSNNLVRASIVVLQNPSSKLWAVKLCSIDSKCGKRSALRGKGWHEFYVDNKLKEGDVCLFELDLTRKRSDVVVITVHIFPLVT